MLVQNSVEPYLSIYLQIINLINDDVDDGFKAICLKKKLMRLFPSEFMNYFNFLVDGCSLLF